MRSLPNNPYGWGCIGSLAVLGVLTLLGESTPLRLGNNQPGLLFVLLAVGFLAGFSVAARIQWRSRDASPDPGALGADVDTGDVAAGSPMGSPGLDPSRAILDTRSGDIHADPGAQVADRDIAHVAAGSPMGSPGQAPSRALVDTLSCAGWGGGACLGFIAILVLAWNGIVGNDAWLIIGPIGGAIIGSGITALVLWRLRSAARDTP